MHTAGNATMQGVLLADGAADETDEDTEDGGAEDEEDGSARDEVDAGIQAMLLDPLQTGIAFRTQLSTSVPMVKRLTWLERRQLFWATDRIVGTRFKAVSAITHNGSWGIIARPFKLASD